MPDECLAIFLVGSSARGWSHARSDFDIYLVSERQLPERYANSYSIPTQPAKVYSETFYRDGRRWEATNWLDAQVGQIIAKVDPARFSGIPGPVLAGREELLLERMTTAVPFLGQAWLADRQGDIKASAFRSMVIARSLATADDAIEDAVGTLESGDARTAVMAARRALGHSVDALLEDHGQFGSFAQKWRPHRFRAAAPDVLSWERYWELETMQTFDPQHPDEWVTEVLAVCREIAMKVEI